MGVWLGSGFICSPMKCLIPTTGYLSTQQGEAIACAGFNVCMAIALMHAWLHGYMYSTFVFWMHKV